MSIKNGHTENGLGLILFYGERLLVSYDGCKLTLSGKDQQPNAKYSGSAYLTSHRVIFLATGSQPAMIVSMPFIYMKKVEIKQPVFGPNHIEGFLSSESGQWQGQVPFKLAFNHGGAIEFGRDLLKLGSEACRQQKSYTAPSAPPACDIYKCPPPAYTPFTNDPYYSSFLIPHPEFAPPPADYLYQTNAYPPYPGAVPPPYTPAGAPPPYAAADSAPQYPAYGATNGFSYQPFPPAYPPAYSQIGPPNYPYPPANPQSGAPNYANATANPQNVGTGYVFPQQPNTFYAPPYAEASAPPMEPEDKKNI